MNEHFESYFNKALQDAKISELIDNYTKRGFVVQKTQPENHDNYDLVLRNEAKRQTVAFEVKLLPLDNESKDAIERLRQQAQNMGYEFHLVTIARPTRYSIDIEWLDSALIEYLINNPIEDIGELATHTHYENVETHVEALTIAEDTAIARVHGTIDVELQYGSNSDLANDIGMAASHSFPFEGELELDVTTQSINTADLHVDLSEWVEE